MPGSTVWTRRSPSTSTARCRRRCWPPGWRPTTAWPPTSSRPGPCTSNAWPAPGRSGPHRDGQRALALRVEPAPVGTGLDYALGDGVERGYLLPSFHVAIEETLAAELGQGLYGWRITDLRVRVVHSRLPRADPLGRQFRRLTVTTFRRALQQAGTTVCAPVSRFEPACPRSRCPRCSRRSWPPERTPSRSRSAPPAAGSPAPSPRARSQSSNNGCPTSPPGAASSPQNRPVTCRCAGHRLPVRRQPAVVTK